VLPGGSSGGPARVFDLVLAASRPAGALGLIKKASGRHRCQPLAFAGASLTLQYAPYLGGFVVLPLCFSLWICLLFWFCS
jgi:hypothetical protein